MVIYQVVIVSFLEVKFTLSYYTLLKVDYEVVVDHTIGVHSLLLDLVGYANCKQLASFGLPCCTDRTFHFCHIIRLSYCVFDLIVMINSLGIFSEIKGLELKKRIVSLLEPYDHRVIIAFFDVMFIIPLIIFGFVYSIRFFFLERVRVITQPEAIVILTTKLLHTEQLSLRKSLNICLIAFFIHELMFVLSHFIFFKIDYSYLIFSSL